MGCDWTHTAAAQHLWPLTSVGAVPGRWVTDDGGSFVGQLPSSRRGHAHRPLLSWTHFSTEPSITDPWQTPRVCVWHPDLASGSVILMNRCEHTHTHAHTHGCMPTGILTCTHTLMHTLTQMCTHKRMSMHTHTQKNRHMYSCVLVDIHKHSHTHICYHKHMVLTSR